MLCIYAVDGLVVRALTSVQKVFGLIPADTKSFDFTVSLDIKSQQTESERYLSDSVC